MNSPMRRFPAIFLPLCLFSLLPAIGQVKTGADLLFQRYFQLIDGKRVGLVTNHSALLSDGRHLADALFEDSRTKLVALFGPEHGIRGDAPDGKSIQGGRDAKTGVPVYSLYGAINKPTAAMLKDVDVLIFDIQDVGVRFYTYVSTMSYAMEAAAEHKIPFVVLDRPDPIRGVWVEGFVREDSLRSFVGLQPIPIAYGMTIGELAEMFNGEGWLKDGVKADLTVVKMEGWKRTMWYDQTGLRWVKPSPSMTTLSTAVVYPGTCFIEGTNLSEGRGTDHPFEYIGAPFVDGRRWADALNSSRLRGVRFEPVEFTPRSLQNITIHPKYEGMRCSGIYLDVTDRDLYEPVKTGVCILSTARQLFPDSLKWRGRYLDLLSGTSKLRSSIDSGMSPDKIVGMWKGEIEKFKQIRKRYLIY
jgi:uncharacterized protein YbbC (DUF1343 family)